MTTLALRQAHGLGSSRDEIRVLARTRQLGKLRPFTPTLRDACGLSWGKGFPFGEMKPLKQRDLGLRP